MTVFAAGTRFGVVRNMAIRGWMLPGERGKERLRFALDCFFVYHLYCLVICSVDF